MSGADRIVAVDPDTSKPGVAVFFGDVLVGARAWGVEDALAFVAGYVSSERGTRGVRRRVLIEMPQQYGGVGDRRDFLRLAAVVGRFQQAAIAAGAECRLVEPREWKGQVPKGATSLRVWNALSIAERQPYADPPYGLLVPTVARGRLERGRGVASGEASDVLDAVGIGLWALGRINARGRRR